MSLRAFQQLIAIGLSKDEIWCACAEPGPWTQAHAQAVDQLPDDLPACFLLQAE